MRKRKCSFCKREADTTVKGYASCYWCATPIRLFVTAERESNRKLARRGEPTR